MKRDLGVLKGGKFVASILLGFATYWLNNSVVAGICIFVGTLALIDAIEGAHTRALIRIIKHKDEIKDL